MDLLVYSLPLSIWKHLTSTWNWVLMWLTNVSKISTTLSTFLENSGYTHRNHVNLSVKLMYYFGTFCLKPWTGPKISACINSNLPDLDWYPSLDLTICRCFLAFPARQSAHWNLSILSQSTSSILILLMIFLNNF